MSQIIFCVWTEDTQSVIAVNDVIEYLLTVFIFYEIESHGWSVHKKSKTEALVSG